MTHPTCPALQLPMTGDKTFDTEILRGQAFVLYFYPKDNTPGCTTEGSDFRDRHADFLTAGCQVFGISRDSVKSHEGFKCKQSYSFELVSDPDEIACRAFDVIKNKKMYGKEVKGIERSTFVIDCNGLIAREWRGVKVPNHVEEVLEFVKTLG